MGVRVAVGVLFCSVYLLLVVVVLLLFGVGFLLLLLLLPSAFICFLLFCCGLNILNRV